MNNMAFNVSDGLKAVVYLGIVQQKKKNFSIPSIHMCEATKQSPVVPA